MPEIYIYDEIIEGSAERFISQIREASGDLTIRINSPGGVVSEGLAIYNALARYAGNVTVEIDGLAASIASLIAMAGNTVRVAEAGLMMVHAPWTMTGGSATELRKTADALDANAEVMVSAYARKTGRDREAILALMEAETWMTAAQAVEAGFADEVMEAPDLAASVAFDLTRFNHPPIEVFAMADKSKQAAAGAAGNDDKVSAERERVAEINRMCRTVNAHGKADELIRAGTSVEAARAAIIDHLAEQDTAPEIDHHLAVMPGRDDRRDFRAAAVDGVLSRYGIPAGEAHPAAADFKGMSVKELAAACLSRDGRSVQGSKADSIIRAAMTTSDFPALMEDVARKALMSGFNEESATTHRTWTRQGSIADFKKATRVAVSEAPELLELPEDAEIKHGSMSDAKETIQLDSYARIVSVSRKALINDDLDGLTRIPRAMGLAAVRKESDLLYNLLTSNPTMRDGTALFHTSKHGNLASSGGTPSIGTLSEARAKMMRQKGLEGSAYLNIRPRYVICPVSLETEFYQLLTSINPNTTDDVVPAWITNLEIVADPRLDDVSTTAWYLAADPGTHDTFEVATLDGDGPSMESDESFETAGMRWRVIADIGVAALDWRGIYKNPGA